MGHKSSLLISLGNFIMDVLRIFSYFNFTKPNLTILTSIAIAQCEDN